MTHMAEPLNLIPLGGVGELGKNMFAVQHGQRILLVDGGFAYAPSGMLGVEFLVPAPEWIIENRKKIVGWVLTHAHEDHIGGVPYLAGHLPHVPIYGTKFTLEFLKSSLSDAKLDLKALDLREVATDGCIEVGRSFTVDFFRMTHSVPDNVGLVIRTPVGCIVYTGDFKLEHHPLDGKTSQLHKLVQAGQEGVLALLSDSANAERPGFTPSEKIVWEGVDREPRIGTNSAEAVALGHDHHTLLGYHKTSGAIIVTINSDLRAVGYDHVLVDNRIAKRAVPANLAIVHDDRVFDLAMRVDPYAPRQHRAPDGGA